MLDVFQSLGTMLRKCQNKSGVCDGLQLVAWTVLMLRGTPEYVQFISKEVFARLNWILFPQCLHSHNIFGEHLRKVVLTPRRADVDSSKRKHHRPRGVKKCLPPEKKKQDVNRLERIFCFWRSQYSLLSARAPRCRGPNWFNSLRNRSKINGKFARFYWQIQKFFTKSSYSQYWLCVLFQLRNFHSDEIRFRFFNWDWIVLNL